MRETAFATLFFALLVVASSVASQKTGTPDREGAVAAALKDTLAEFLDEDEMHQKNPPHGFAVFCIETEVDVDVAAIASDLSETIIRPVPVDRCTSRTVEGDFGMFTALTTFYDESGDEAGHFKIAKAECVSTSECQVDLDFMGWGDRFHVKRQGAIWHVTRRINLWVV